MTTRRALLAAAAAAFPIGARAQRAWPDRPVKVLVGYAPGGGVDIVARLLAEPMRVASFFDRSGEATSQVEPKSRERNSTCAPK